MTREEAARRNTMQNEMDKEGVGQSLNRGGSYRGALNGK